MYIQTISGLAQDVSNRTSHNSLDKKAQAIILKAQNQNVHEEERAKQAVWDIIKTYYPATAGIVDRVKYVKDLGGLETDRVKRDGQTKGVIRVGHYFVGHVNNRFFARRVLQVGHELAHINQFRMGMVGDVAKHEREFRAHYWASTTKEIPGTGRVSHTTRVTGIDCALRHFNCLGKEKQKKYSLWKEKLLELRKIHQKASGRPATAIPTGCDLKSIENC
jgi:hypothetical protein